MTFSRALFICFIIPFLSDFSVPEGTRPVPPFGVNQSTPIDLNHGLKETKQPIPPHGENCFQMMLTFHKQAQKLRDSDMCVFAISVCMMSQRLNEWSCLYAISIVAQICGL